MRSACSILAFLAMAAVAAAQDKPNLAGILKALPFKGYKGDATGLDAKKPTVVTNDEELAKAIPDKEWQAKLKKQVDLTKNDLVLFGWVGPSSQSLDYKVVDKDNVLFTFRPIATGKDVSHWEAFSLKRGTKFTVEEQKKK